MILAGAYHVTAYTVCFYKKLKNVSCEYYHVNGWNRMFEKQYSVKNENANTSGTSYHVAGYLVPGVYYFWYSYYMIWCINGGIPLVPVPVPTNLDGNVKTKTIWSSHLPGTSKYSSMVFLNLRPKWTDFAPTNGWKTERVQSVTGIWYFIQHNDWYVHE